jgi:tetratricopeptide (TPR) repeat protein
MYDFNGSNDLLQHAISIDGDNPLYYNQLSSGFLHMGKYDEALEASNKAIELADEKYDFYFNMIRALWGLGEAKKALIFLDELIDKRNNEDNKSLLITKAKYLNKMRKNQDSIDMYKRIINLDSKYYQAYTGLSSLYGDENRYAEIDIMIDKILVNREETGEWYYAISKMYEYKKDYANAIEYCKQAIFLDDNELYNHLLAILHQNSRKYKESLDFIYKSISINSYNPDLYDTLAISYRHLGDYEKSLEMSNKAISKVPSDEDFLLTLAITYEQYGFTNEAIDVTKRAILIAESIESKAYLAYLYAGLEMYEDAIKAYEEILKLDSQSSLLYSNAGYLYLSIGDLNNARKHYMKSLQLNKKFSWPLLGMANLEKITGNRKRYEAYMSKIKENLDYNDEFMLCCYYVATEDYEQALITLDYSLSIHFISLKWLEQDIFIKPLHNDIKYRKIVDKYTNIYSQYH